jgi:hypothetical protein
MVFYQLIMGLESIQINAEELNNELIWVSEIIDRD